MTPKKTALVQVKVTREERDRWNVAAAQEGMSVAELVRELMRARIERQRNDLLVKQAIHLRQLELATTSEG